MPLPYLPDEKDPLFSSEEPIFNSKKTRIKAERAFYEVLVNPTSVFWNNAVEYFKIKMTDEEIADMEQLALDRFSRRKKIPHIGHFASNPPTKIAGQTFEQVKNRNRSKTSNYYVNPITPKIQREKKLSRAEIKALISAKLDEIGGRTKWPSTQAKYNQKKEGK